MRSAPPPDLLVAADDTLENDRANAVRTLLGVTLLNVGRGVLARVTPVTDGSLLPNSSVLSRDSRQRQRGGGDMRIAGMETLSLAGTSRADVLADPGPAPLRNVR